MNTCSFSCKVPWKSYNNSSADKLAQEPMICFSFYHCFMSYVNLTFLRGTHLLTWPDLRLNNTSFLTVTYKQSVISIAYPRACSQILLKSSYIGKHLQHSLIFFQCSSLFSIWVPCAHIANFCWRSLHQPWKAGRYFTLARDKKIWLK